MEQKKAGEVKKPLTQKDFKDNLEKMTPAQAVTNLKNLISFAMTKGIIADIDKVIILERSLDVLEQAAGPLAPPEPLCVLEEMKVSDNETQEMIN
jgi:hypothetical protein